MADIKKLPYVLYVAEIIYSKISLIKKNNPNISIIDSIERFMSTKIYEKISKK